MPKIAWPSKNSEKLSVNQNEVRWLSELVKCGEGLNLEFKAKATHPDKIVKELIAFANTKGGTLLIGLNDDGNISGVRYPEEDSTLVVKAISRICRPTIKIKYRYIRLNEKKWVVVFDVAESKRKPIQFLESKGKSISYIRSLDKSIQASPEAEGILRILASRKANVFPYGEEENKILKLLEQKGAITLPEMARLTGIAKPLLSSKLICLAAARVIGWNAAEPLDWFCSINTTKV